MKHLFIDMDGTLAVWCQTSTMEMLYSKGYYRNLPPHNNVLAAVKSLIGKYPTAVEPHILSAYFTDSPYAFTEKNEWLDEFLPEIPNKKRLFVPVGRNKATFISNRAGQKCFLLDDYTVNLTQWETDGGYGIKLINDINHTNGTWKGPYVDYSWTPENIEKELAKIMGLT